MRRGRAAGAALAAILAVSCAPNRRVASDAAGATSTAVAARSGSPPATATTIGSSSTTPPSIAVAPGIASAATAPSAPSTSVPEPTAVVPPLLVGLAVDAAGLARQLTDALRTIRDRASGPDAVAAAGRRQQLVLRRLAAHPEWQADALAATGDDVRALATNDVTALDAPGDRSLAAPVPPLETLPLWTIRAPLPAGELLGYYHEAQAATGIPWTYLAAINLVETRMGRIAGSSSAGAVGPMQFLPSTWAGCCTGDPTVDRDAIVGAATYLARRGGPADMGRAVLGYNPNAAYRVMVERYAANLAADERMYLGYHAWEVFVATTVGPLRLPVGFSAASPVPAAEYAAAHPEDRA